ncbi:PAS domain S-box protein [Frigoriglobus tundricola]|uniref:histidine kinase n=1 Tax=Frigoriglobus tundricola TaxID=2774151 RepID=A0A6M5YL70_9BACT|nr:PAS domain S-box protein [Frigoriglobus tundricola]QJW94675.1 Sensory box histidine kinase/response regulator [Frigoriglobus tundricola]
MGNPLRVLVVADSPAAAERTLFALRQGGLEPKWERADTADGLRGALTAGPWDAVVSDGTPSGSGLDVVRAADPDLPFVVVSGAGGEDVAVALMRAGASDCVREHDLDRLAPVVEREVREAGARRAKRAGARATAHLAAVVESSEDAIISAKAGDGVVTSWNPAAERLYGWTAAAAVGRHVSFFVPPDKTDELDGIMRRLRAGERVEYFETVRLHRDGRRIDVSLTISPVRDADGQLIGVSKIARDIRERKRAEEALRRSEERYRGLIESIPALVWVYDATGRPLLHNHRWHEYTGQSPEDVAADRWHEAVHPDDAARACAVWERCKASGEPYTCEYRLRRADGVYRWFLSQGIRSRDSGGTDQWVGICTDIDDRMGAEDALRLRDRTIQAATQGLMITDSGRPDNPLVYVSPGFERMTGYGSAEVLGRNCRMLQGKDTDPATVARLREAIRAGEPRTVELLNYRKDGTPFWNELSVSPVRDATGRLTHFVGVQVDVTARRSLEDQFRQAQKMEAVGQLAAGVAHDFNNLLTIINGYSDLLLQGLAADDPARNLVAEILKAGERSAGLTRQLLAFSRQQVLAPRVLDINAVVTDTEKMLRRLIGEDVRLTTTLAPDLWAVRADPGQVEQVLMNLAVNARDAMPRGGRLTIETRNVDLDGAYARTNPDARAGPHVLLSVMDTGVGMTPEVQAKIFEPFFTTKGPGKGTGLGLATVYGVVKQSGGHVGVYSEVGVGTAFKVYLPRAERAPGESPSHSGLRAAPRGTETVLLVEDEDGVRALTRRVLTGSGYTVIEAADGDEAVRLATVHEGPIHLLVTDVVMPGPGGRVVAERVAELHPGIRVLFVSGYTDDAVIRHGVLREGVNFLQKPFAPILLAFKVREALDAPSGNRQPRMPGPVRAPSSEKLHTVPGAGPEERAE